MTTQSTIDKLIEMRLTSMSDAFRTQMEDPRMKGIPFEVFFASTFSSKMQIEFLKVAWGISPVLHFLLRHSFRCRRGVVAGIQSLLVTDM